MRPWRSFLLLLGSAACVRTPLGLRAVEGGRVPLPRYPAVLMASGVEGASLVTIVWRDDGAVDTSKSHRLRETHPAFTESLMRAIRQWRAVRLAGDSVLVEALFALNNGLCAKRDSLREPASRAKLRADREGVHILVEAEDCLPCRPPVALRTGKPPSAVDTHASRE